MARITAGKVIRIAVLPGIVPRVRHLLTGGFGYVSFYIAQLFYAIRLLPRGHPYLNISNFGRFGISHVTAEAWRTIVHGQRQIDQIIIFGLVLLGIAILFVQFCFLGVALFAQSAHALPALPAGGFLNTINPTDDLAFILLDSVFGLPDFFGSCVEQAIVCFPGNQFPQPAAPFPLPYHEGLRMMFQIYSIGLLTIAMIIFSYFAVAILIETAESGTPFGKRYQHLWAPLRMVMALALLIPIANGLNAAQYMVMYAAKWGSGFATTGWTLFVTEATVAAGGTLLGNTNSLIAVPNAPPVNNLLEFATVMSACRAGEASGVNSRRVQAYVVFPDQAGPASRADLVGLTYADAIQRSGYGNIHYVFGVYETDDGTPTGNPRYSSFPGQVDPACGELVLQITDVDDVNSPGSRYILEQYHRLITIMWLDIDTLGASWAAGYQSMGTMGYGFIRRLFPGDIRDQYGGIPDTQDPNYPKATAFDLNGHREFYATEVTNIIQAGIAIQVTSPAWLAMVQYGWAGAGIWYNNVARLNGTILAAAHSLPQIRKYPAAMEYVATQRLMERQEGTGPERHNPELSNGKSIKFNPPKLQHMAYALYEAQKAWEGSYTSVPAGGANPALDAINAIFGTEGLFELSENTNTHPLAGLVAIGKSLVDSSIRNLGAAAGAGILGGVANFFKEVQPMGKLLISASSATLQISMIAFSIGFLLFYVLPFIPFLYFFFAVGGWVKGIFESMVAVPLWALAHIRIDGEGLPGDAARGGYFMIFEIFLRPLMIVFGLLAAITIFSAQVKILNEIWPLVTSNLTGFNATTAKGIAAGEVGSLTYARSVVDKFFFTVMYAIVVYMMGMASFKLIDMLPDKVMRWMGTDASGFSDQSSTGPEGLMTKMSVGTNMMTGSVGSLGRDGMSALANRPAP